jgi:alkaline phosphatase D
MIHVWDDHESANDSHKDGAQNHQAATEGRWDVRKAVSKRVAYEWLPTRENADTIIYRQFAFGSLVDLIMLDTRLEGRDPQIEGVLPSSPQSAKDSINAPNRTVLGEKQFEWFIDRLRSSQAAWRVIGNQVMFAPLRVDKVDIDRVRRYSFVLSLLAPTLMETLQEAFYGDVWTNYPAERKKIVDSIERHGIRNVVIATGDFHTSFAMDVTLNAADPSRYDAATGRGAVAVEFMCPSVSSANFDENIPGALSSVINGVMRTLGFPSPQRESFAEQMALRDTRELLGVLDDALKEQNRHLKYHNLTEHGYTLLDLKPERAQGDYWFVDTILTPSRRERFAAGFFTQNGQNNLQRASAPASPKAAQALPAPARPLRVTLVSDVPPLAEEAAKDVEFGGGLTLLGFFPNPAEASAAGYAHYTLKAASLVTVEILDAMGNIVLTPVRNQLQSGHVTALFDLSALPAGAYTCRICTASETRARVCYSPLSAEGCFLSGDKTAFRLSAS